MLKYKHDKKERNIMSNEARKLVPKDVADYFLSKKALSPKKVQKLVYYAYAWYIALYNESIEAINESLFTEEPEAWMHGPVFRSLYNSYKHYGWQEIPKQKEANLHITKIASKSLKNFLDDVWKKYGKFTADQLEFMTHQEDPWRKARVNIKPLDSSNAKISKKDIFAFYNS